MSEKPFPPMPERLRALILEHRISNRALAKMGDFLVEQGGGHAVGPVLLNGDHVLSIVAELTWRRSVMPDLPIATPACMACLDGVCREHDAEGRLRADAKPEKLGSILERVLPKEPKS